MDVLKRALEAITRSGTKQFATASDAMRDAAALASARRLTRTGFSSVSWLPGDVAVKAAPTPVRCALVVSASEAGDWLILWDRGLTERRGTWTDLITSGDEKWGVGARCGE